MCRISKTKAGIVPATKEPLLKNFELHMSFSAVLINADIETENKFLAFGPVKML